MSSTSPEAATGSALGPADDRPLTDQEYQLLQRLLSDPFSFPAPFKAWLVSYLETSDMNLPISAVHGLTGILGITGIGGGTLGIFPAGIVLPFGGDTAPVGSKMCDGASYDRVAEVRLYTAIGVKYGAVDASHFNVPDMRGRAPVGLGTQAEVNALGANEGLPVGSRTPRHNSTVVENPHIHNFPHGNAAAADMNMVDNFIQNRQGVLQTDAAVTGITVGPGGVRPTDTIAFEVLNFIIIS